MSGRTLIDVANELDALAAEVALVESTISFHGDDNAATHVTDDAWDGAQRVWQRVTERLHLLSDEVVALLPTGGVQ